MASQSYSALKKLTINDLPLLCNTLNPVASNCFALGLQLGVEYPQICTIENDYRKSKDQLREIISERLKQDSPLTWCDIVTALRSPSVNHPDLARQIESQYISPSSDPQGHMSSFSQTYHLSDPQQEKAESSHLTTHTSTTQVPAHYTYNPVHTHPSTNATSLYVSHPSHHPHHYLPPKYQSQCVLPPQYPTNHNQYPSSQYQPHNLPPQHPPHTPHYPPPQHLPHTPHYPPPQHPPHIPHYPPSQHLPHNPHYPRPQYAPHNPHYPPPQHPLQYTQYQPPSLPTHHPQSTPQPLQSLPPPSLHQLVSSDQSSSTPSSPVVVSQSSLHHTQLGSVPTSHTQILGFSSEYGSPPAKRCHLQTTSSHNPTINTASKLMTQFIDYVRTVYKRGSKVERDTKVVKWPPTPSKVFINLACIDRMSRGLKAEYDDITEAMVRDGNVDVVEGKKWQIGFSQIACGLPATPLETVILVEGAPGVGKSTFAWEFCRRWERGEIAQQYQLVLLLRLRDERMSRAESLKDLIYHPSKNICQAVVEELEPTLGVNTLIILEGFDELPDPQCREPSIFLQLILGQQLPLATILVTSRPWATGALLVKIKNRIFQYVEILGFTEENITKYVTSVFTGEGKKTASAIDQSVGGPDEVSEEAKKNIDDVMAYIGKYPQIKACMYIPLNAAIVVSIYREGMKSKWVLPTTLTELYQALTQILLQRHLCGHAEYCHQKWSVKSFEDLPREVYSQFLVISKIAYDGVCRPGEQSVQLIFPNIPDNFETLGLMQSVSQLFTDGQKTSHNFLNLTFQEFLAAFFISTMSSLEQLKHFQRHKDGRLKVVLRFLAGLTKHAPLSSSFEITPLIIKFTDDCVPLGCFEKTISCLLLTYEQTDSIGEGNSPEHLPHNVASLFCPTHTLLLVNSSDHIEVYNDADIDVLPKVRENILGAIRKVLDSMHLTEIDVSPAVLCPCKKVSQSHPASLREVESEMFICCSRTKLNEGTADEKHVMWFGDNILASPEHILQAALKEGSIPHRDDKFLIHGPGGAGKSSLIAMFLGKTRSLNRTSTELATDPLHLTPIRDVSTSTYTTNWERVDYERLSHMIAHACYKCYLLKGKLGRGGGEGDGEEVGVEKRSGGNAGEGIDDNEVMGGLIVSSAENSQSTDSQTTPAVRPVAQKSNQQQAELHELQQDKPKPCLANEAEVLSFPINILEDDTGNIKWALSDFLKGLQEKVWAAENRNEKLLSHSIRILDSGGQPQFHELIAIFLSHISGFISVFKLNEELSKHGEVVLYDEGQPISDPYESYYTHEQVIRHNLQALQAEASQRASQSDGLEMPNLAFVGTFLDKIDECNETPAMKDKRLHSIITEMLPPDMQQCVITCGGSLKQVTFQINAQTPTTRDFDTVEGLKRALLKNSQVQSRDLPLRWHGLEVALHVLMEKLNRQVLTRDECKIIADPLKFDPASLKAALDYLHQLNIIAHYDVLPDVIFGSSQVILNKITELVCYSLVLKGKKGLNGAQRDFVQHGIMSLKLLRELTKHYIPGLFEAKDLLKVLISQLVLSEVGEEEFIMPCVLEVSSIYPSPPLPEGSVRSSFILHFSKESPMFGVYCCTISSLMTDAGWKLLIEDGEMQVARNSFTFKVPKGLPGKVIFRDPLSSYLEVILEYPVAVVDEHRVTLYREVCNEFFKAITKAMETLHYDVQVPKISFMCPQQSLQCSAEPPHPAIVDESQTYLTCSLKPSSVCCHLTEQQKKWLQNASDSTRSLASLSCAPSSDSVTVSQSSTATSQEQHTQGSTYPTPSLSTSSNSQAPTASSHEQSTEHTPGTPKPSTSASSQAHSSIATSTEEQTQGSTRPTAPDMVTLRRLSTHYGVINIIQQTAARYRDIGILLLNDTSGAIVDSIKESVRGDPVAAVDMIYTRWMEEDVDYSWKKLIQCFRDCGLNSLASDIEQHFGLPSPQQMSESASPPPAKRRKM